MRGLVCLALVLQRVSGQIEATAAGNMNVQASLRARYMLDPCTPDSKSLWTISARAPIIARGGIIRVAAGHCAAALLSPPQSPSPRTDGTPLPQICRGGGSCGILSHHPTRMLICMHIWGSSLHLPPHRRSSIIVVGARARMLTLLPPPSTGYRRPRVGHDLTGLHRVIGRLGLHSVAAGVCSPTSSRCRGVASYV